MASSIRALGDRVVSGGRGDLFDAAYYSERFGPNPYNRNDGWLRFFGSIADEVVRSLHPRRVFDAGCAMGMLVESFWDRGVEAWGADISPYAISCVRRDMQPYCTVASISEPLDRSFDLVTCIEVLEHMPEEEARLAIAQMSESTGLVLFSSTPTDLTEPTHINVHPVIYWLKLFGAYGFVPDLTYDARFVSAHAILFRKNGNPLEDDVLQSFAQKLRLNAALVERDQHIAGLNARIEHLTAESAASAGEARLANQSAAEAAAGRAAAEQKAAELAAARELAEERVAELAAAQELAVQIAAERSIAGQAAAERSAAELEASKARLAEALERISSLEALNGTLAQKLEAESRTRASEAAEAAAVLKAEKSALDSRNLRLSATASELKAALAEIQESPGWKIVLRYRKWLSSGRARRSWVNRWWEPAAARIVGRAAQREAEAQVEPAPDHEAVLLPYDHWIQMNEPCAQDLANQRHSARQFAFRPRISILVPVYKVSRAVLTDTIDSVLKQTYDRWELCLVHADPAAAEQRSWLTSLAASDERIRVDLLESNLGISGNSNRALELSSGEFLALLDHDDTLAPHALFEVVERLNQNPELDFIYSDKDQLSEDGRQRVEPLFKPAWSPDLILCANYLTHFSVLRADTVRRIGGWRASSDGAQDWDLFVRAIEDPRRAAHVPKVLYHWRRVATSVAGNGLEAKPYAAAAQLGAVQECLAQRKWNAVAAFSTSGMIQLRWNQERRRKSEVIEVSTSDSAARLNERVRQSPADVLIFMDQNVQPAAGNWLEEMTAPLAQPGIAITGCKLLDAATYRIRHAGICFNADGELDYPFASEDEYIHNAFGGPNWYRNWLAVSGACFAIRRDVFDAAGGFSEAPEYPRLDVDLCLKVAAAGSWRVFYNPFARMLQSGGALLEKWLVGDGPAAGARLISEKFPRGDPFFNPNLVSRNGRIALRNLNETPASPYEGQLVRRPGSTAEDGKVYVVRNGVRHWIMDHRWATRNGYRWPADVKVVPRSDLDPIPQGEPFNYMP